MSPTILSVAAFFLCFDSVSASGNLNINQRFIEYPSGGIATGQGWDSITGNKKISSAIDFSVDTKNPGQRSVIKLERIADGFTLNRRLEVGDENVLSGILGKYITPKFKFVNDMKIKSSDVVFLADGEVLNIEETISSVTLTPEALALAKNDTDEFYKKYGNSFVSSMQTGAELLCTMTFSTQNVTERAELDAGISLGGFLSLTFNRTVDKFTDSSRLSLSCEKNGGVGGTLPTDSKTFFADLANLAQVAKDNPVPLSVGLTRYDDLPDFPTNSAKPLPQPTDNMAILIRRYYQYKAIRDDIDEIEENNNNYFIGCGVTDDDLRNTKTEVRVGLLDMLAEITKIQNGGNITEVLPAKMYRHLAALPLPKAYIQGIKLRQQHEETRHYWIDTKDRVYCQLQESDPDCLSPLEENKFATRIRTNQDYAFGDYEKQECPFFTRRG